VGAVCSGAFMSQLGAGVVNSAYPELQVQFHTGLAAVTWVTLSYMLVLTGTLVLFGRLSDLRGRKLLYLYGVGVFLVGSIACAAAPNLAVLDLARVLQAVGAAMVQANSVAIVVLSVPPVHRAKALGFQSAFQALGLALGPTIGGLLLGLGGWRLLFLVNLPFALVTLLVAWAFIPRSRDLQLGAGLDLTGAALLFGAVAALLSSLTLATASHWRSPFIALLAAATVVLVVAFLAQERRVRFPLVRLSLFSESRFSLGVVSAAVAFCCLFGLILLVPFLAKYTFGQPVWEGGLELMALPLAIFVVSPLAGRMVRTFGERRATALALGVAVVGFAALATIPHHPAELVLLLGLTGAGVGLFLPANNATLMGAVEASDAGLASGIVNMARGLGTALGLSFTTLVFISFGGGDTSAGQVDAGFRAATAALGLLAAANLAAMVVVGRRAQPKVKEYAVS